jgi:hypothetical protein
MHIAHTGITSTTFKSGIRLADSLQGTNSRGIPCAGTELIQIYFESNEE